MTTLFIGSRLGNDCSATAIPICDSPSEANMAARNIRISEHRFHIGQSVQFFPGPGIDHRSRGQYTIVLLRPLDGGAPQYRVKHKVDGHERIVCENELGSP